MKKNKKSKIEIEKDDQKKLISKLKTQEKKIQEKASNKTTREEKKITERNR